MDPFQIFVFGQVMCTNAWSIYSLPGAPFTNTVNLNPRMDT